MMMKSVALTESLFIRGGHGTGSDDHDYVVVDVPAFSLAAAEGNNDDDDDDDDEIEGTIDDDDASYDYCDEFPALVQKKDLRTKEKVASPPPALREIPFEINLSFVVDDDVGSVCPPSITEDEEEVAVVVDDCYVGSSNNISALSTSMNKDVDTDHQSMHGEDTTKNCIIHFDVVDETNHKQDAALVTDTSDNVPQEMASTHPPAISIEDTQVNNENPSDTDASDNTGITGEGTKGLGTITELTIPAVEDIKNTIDEAWIETTHTSRQSNKKRRKQMKLAKRAATTAAAMAKLSSSSSSSPPNTIGRTSNKVMMINRRGCGGNKVAPIMEMKTAVVGM